MDTRQRVAELIEDHSVLEVAHILEISPQAVYKHLKSLGIKPPTKEAS